MGFGSFLKKLTKSPFKATSQLVHGKPLQAFKTGITGGGTAPFSNAAPLLGGIREGGGNRLQQGLTQMMASQPPSPPPGSAMGPTGGISAGPSFVPPGAPPPPIDLGSPQGPNMDMERRKMMIQQAMMGGGRPGY